MNSKHPVPLERHFSPVPQSEYDSDEQPFLEALRYSDNKSWSEIDKRFRTVILAEAGAGKTYEMFARAKFIENEGRSAFFIRIEDVVDDFTLAFEVGSSESFQKWLSSQTEAWFFLDSVDEARLSNPRDFEKAIRRFADAIKPAQLRAHICISSRPYSWRPKSDRKLIERFLQFKKSQVKTTEWYSELGESSDSFENELEIFQLDPLDENDIRLFAEHRSTPEVDVLIEDIERLDVMTLAERPFDLEGILDKWKFDRSLGSRSELLKHNIELRLNELDPDNQFRRSLEPDKAREGARLLAAAVILCDESGIQVPDNTHERAGIKADAVLSNWNQRDIQTLLERAVFNDVTHGTVRFRHREVREFLATEWFVELLQKGSARHDVESLIFREQYGEQIISPRLRSLLPWLILKDDSIRNRVLDIHTEITLEGGDLACLPLFEQKKILNGVLTKIVQAGKRSITQDYSAVARIAHPDLADETLSLIERHCAHDDAVFFLGRLVWQGKMQKCVQPLFTIAIDPGRKINPRMAAILAINSCGTDEQRFSLWNIMLNVQSEISRELLCVLLQGAATDVKTIDLLLKTIEKLPPYERFKVSGLRQALHGYIDRLPVLILDANQPLSNLVDGLKIFLDRTPHIEQFFCPISEEFRWLLEPSIHAVERLVIARTDAAMQDNALAILLNAPSIRESIGEHYDDYKDNLRDLVPAWPELNDTLFWRQVETKRTCLKRDGNQLNDYFQVRWPDHYWSFGTDSFSRILDWIKTCQLEDDRLVSLTLAFHLFDGAGRPPDWLEKLRLTVKCDTALATQLDNLLNPTMSEQELELHQQEMRHKEKYRRQRLEEKRNRSNWINDLKANPELIRKPPKLKPGEISNGQYWLMREIEENNMSTRIAHGADWKLLTDEFGDDVARAYRDAAMKHWRVYDPGIPSENTDTSSISNSLSFALSGLEIEAQECSDFPSHLDESEVNHALRYITWEINGFPSWFETIYRDKPLAVMEAIQTEIIWELDNTEPDQKSYRILHDLTHYAPWLHQTLIEPLRMWLRGNDPSNADTLRNILHILKSGRMDPVELGALSKSKTTTTQCDELLSQWYAIWVDAQPDLGIPALSNWLSGLGANRNSKAAQIFVTALTGDRHHTGPNIENFCTAEHLKRIHVLMHTYIRIKDDIHHTGTYSPVLRDHAQEARDRIFHLLSETQGKETYVALMELSREHPNPEHQSWMAGLAYRRAEADGDLEPWTELQVSELNSNLIRTPATQRQLFDLTVGRLTDMKIWLEQGDSSPYATWQNVEAESEMRNLVAGWLDQNANSHFTITQEAEISNKQRIDIWLQNPSTRYPIPIELKLLDNGWTGPGLCERLRNQLARDYLCEGVERDGVMLLIRQGVKPKKRWMVEGKLVDISTLQDALEKYWGKIAGCYPYVSNIQVIVIDLTLRAIKSKSNI